MLKLLYHAWGAMLEVQEGSHGGTVVCSNNNIMYCHKCQLSKLITHSWRQPYIIQVMRWSRNLIPFAVHNT